MCPSAIYLLDPLLKTISHAQAAQLISTFPYPKRIVPTKAGLYVVDDDLAALRAARVRKKLKELSATLAGNKRKDIIVVTYSVFMKFLSSKRDIDLPKASWRSYIGRLLILTTET
ncbi:hypothetical protein GQ44DRAFT_714630 [Phaeosphaeriaceae sp. PMI808]|nr:hypothetical protein GQ44DRAFT_714630 [Phaeosphaeriaceae sp. PMI808]